MVNDLALPKFSFYDQKDLDDETITLMNLDDRAEVSLNISDDTLAGQTRSVPLIVLDQTTEEVNFKIDLQLLFEATPVPYFTLEPSKIFVEEGSNGSYFEYIDLPEITNIDRLSKLQVLADQKCDEVNV